MNCQGTVPFPEFGVSKLVAHNLVSGKTDIVIIQSSKSSLFSRLWIRHLMANHLNDHPTYLVVRGLPDWRLKIYKYFLNAKVTLCPPKPNELDRATSTFCVRYWWGT
jgi:hypothetical protein